jgi:hypothetical protein
MCFRKEDDTWRMKFAKMSAEDLEAMKVWMCECLSVCLSVGLSVCRSVCFFIHLFLYTLQQKTGMPVGGMVKRKGQLTFVVQEAKAREWELKQHWASSRDARAAAAKRYGFR